MSTHAAQSDSLAAVGAAPHGDDEPTSTGLVELQAALPSGNAGHLVNAFLRRTPAQFAVDNAKDEIAAYARVMSRFIPQHCSDPGYLANYNGDMEARGFAGSLDWAIGHRVFVSMANTFPAHEGMPKASGLQDRLMFAGLSTSKVRSRAEGKGPRQNERNKAELQEAFRNLESKLVSALKARDAANDACWQKALELLKPAVRDRVHLIFKICGSAKWCASCGGVAEHLSVCSRCKAGGFKTYFCTRDCQKAGWKVHKPRCLEMRAGRTPPKPPQARCSRGHALEYFTTPNGRAGNCKVCGNYISRKGRVAVMACHSCNVWVCGGCNDLRDPDFCFEAATDEENKKDNKEK